MTRALDLGMAALVLSCAACAWNGGLGWLVLNAIENQDYFLIQGVFLFIIIGVLLANLVVDIVYVVVDPRTRVGLQGDAA